MGHEEAAIIHLLERIYSILRRVLDRLEHPHEVITGFTIKETTMPLTPPDAGNTLQFTAVPVPAGATLPSGLIPTWTSSDEANAPVTVDPTGLIATVVLSTSITVGDSVTLTITAGPLQDGSTATGTTSFTIGTPIPPPVIVTGFTISQTA